MPRGIFLHKGLSEEHRQKISKAMKGKHHSGETKQKMSLSHRGQIGYYKGKKLSEGHRVKISESLIGIPHPWNRHPHSEECKRKIAQAMRGRRQSKETKRKIGNAHKGIKLSKEHREKLSESHLGYITPNITKRKLSKANGGDKSYRWKGGITPLVKQIRNSFQYRLWRSDIFTRDDFTCQLCGNKGGKLNSHHIKSFSSILQEYEITSFKEALECAELWNINNGITYCKECHKKYIMVISNGRNS